MHYPIFSSIVNTIDIQLEKRGISAKTFSTWENSKINATGLELEINLSKVSKYMKTLSINFDWDGFREHSLAKQLEGMESHPFLKIDKLNESKISPTIDVEVSWLFDVGLCQPELPNHSGNYRIEKASEWMDSVNKKVNQLLIKDDIITRWHIEIEGDEQGRYLSAINLISYFQYQLTSPKSLNEVTHFVSRRLHDLLLKANKVIFIADEILAESVAA